MLGWNLNAQVTTGSISGYVLDPAGLAVTNSTVFLEDEAHSFQRTTVSDRTGLFPFNELPPTRYTLSVSARGFETAHAELVLRVDNHARLDVHLSIAGKGEQITVPAVSPVLNTETAELGAVIDQSLISSLPLNERDFLQLSLLVAGVTTPVAGSQLSTRGGFAMHANGGREEFNNFLLDGVDNVDSDVRGYVLQPSVDTIQEFKIATSNYSAQYGVAGAGQVNVVTRTGANDFHGSAYDYLRNGDLDARNYFDSSNTTKYIRNQFGGALGGPIQPNKTFFFASYDGLREEQQLTQLGTVPTQAERQGDLSGQRPAQSARYVGKLPRISPRHIQPGSCQRTH